MLEKLPPAIGHALQGQRAGLEKILFNKLDLRTGTAQLAISSPAFVDHGPIPARFTADGEGLSPPLKWKGVPPDATTLALIVEDADSPTPEPLVHLIAVDMDPHREAIAEGALLEDRPDGPANLGRNSYLQQRWLPPDPPPGHGTHRYAFQLFALSTGDPFPQAPGRDQLAAELVNRALASGCLIGTYARDSQVKLKTEETVVSAVPVALALGT